MKSLAALICFIVLNGTLLSAVFAGPTSERHRDFWIDGKAVRMVWSARVEAWVSPACGGGAKGSCGALNLLEILRTEGVKIEKAALSGGRNPSTYLCKKLGGELVLARTDRKSEWFFCRAADGSMISAAALSRVL